MTLKDQIIELYPPEERFRIGEALTLYGDNDVFLLGLLESRRAHLTTQEARDASRAAEGKADRALAIAQRAYDAAKGSSDTLSASVGASLRESRDIQRELSGSGILGKALLSRTASALIALSLGFGSFFYLQSSKNSELKKFIEQENRITSASNSAFIEKSLEIARRGTFSAAACYSLASALSLPSVKAAWAPGKGGAISFKADQVQVIQTNGEVQIITDAANAERFRNVLLEIQDAGFLELGKDAQRAYLQLDHPQPQGVTPKK
jgi:hypothetical protein